MGAVTAAPTSSGARKMRRQLDFELNIIPIIDCLTILVTFMLAAGIYYSIAMLDVKVAGGQSMTLDQRPTDIQIAVDVKPSLEMVLKVSGKETKTLSFAPTDGRPDTEDLGKELAALKAKYAPVDTVTLNANKEVAYQSVVLVLEMVRRSHADVLLGGF